MVPWARVPDNTTVKRASGTLPNYLSLTYSPKHKGECPWEPKISHPCSRRTQCQTGKSAPPGTIYFRCPASPQGAPHTHLKERTVGWGACIRNDHPDLWEGVRLRAAQQPRGPEAPFSQKGTEEVKPGLQSEAWGTWSVDAGAAPMFLDETSPLGAKRWEQVSRLLPRY